MEKLQDRISKFSWYQSIDFGDGIKSTGYPWCGDVAWKNMQRFLPDDMTGLRILDLGCNAGIFCVRSALRGAECVGIESDTWKQESDYFEQALFVKEAFEDMSGKKLNIKYIKGDMEKVLATQDLGMFDYCFGIASLYYAKNQDKLIERLSGICEHMIARIRDDNRIALLTGLFEKHGFELKGKFRERLWESLGQKTDDFYLYHYVR